MRLGGGEGLRLGAWQRAGVRERERDGQGDGEEEAESSLEGTASCSTLQESEVDLQLG